MQRRVCVHSHADGCGPAGTTALHTALETERGQHTPSLRAHAGRERSFRAQAHRRRRLEGARRRYTCQQCGAPRVHYAPAQTTPSVCGARARRWSRREPGVADAPDRAQHSSVGHGQRGRERPAAAGSHTRVPATRLAHTRAAPPRRRCTPRRDCATQLPRLPCVTPWASAPRPAAAGARAAVRAAIRATGRRPYVIGKELCRLCAAPDGSRVRARCVTEPPFS